MADAKVSALTTIPAVDRATDLLYIVDSSAGTSNKTTANQLLGITGAPVGTTDSQTLTSKTLTSPTISSPTLSGTLSGTYTIGGTPTFPSSVVTLTGSQTLTNKVLTSPTINTATIANPTLTVDSISEFTSANGVVVDGVTLKDGYVGTNNVRTASIENSAVTYAKTDGKIWWEELGRTTLASTADTITVSGLPAKTYLTIYVKLLQSGAITGLLTFNGDVGNNYALRRSTDFGASTSDTSSSSLSLAPDAAATDKFGFIQVMNVTTREKLVFSNFSSMGAAGAGTVPTARDGYGKWSNTTNQVSSVTLSNSGAGDYAIGSEVIVLGHN